MNTSFYLQNGISVQVDFYIDNETSYPASVTITDTVFRQYGMVVLPEDNDMVREAIIEVCNGNFDEWIYEKVSNEYKESEPDPDRHRDG